MYINATGFYVPATRIPNSYFLEVNGLTDEWIYQRTGIKTRSKATAEETMNYMCIEAVKKASQELPYSIQEVDLIIYASYSPSDTVATTAHVIQRTFSIENAKAFYISSACSSAINAMEIIQSFFKTGVAKKALLVAADRNSTYTNESDPQSGHLWGDAAAALFFSNEQYEENEPKVIEIISQGLGHKGKGPGGVSLDPKNEGIRMPDGKDVFIHACYYIAENTKQILKNTGHQLSDLSYLISHQANMRIISHVAKELNFPLDKTLNNIEELGNTGSVSSILAFSQNYKSFKSNDLICISVFGGGYSAGACLIQY